MDKLFNLGGKSCSNLIKEIRFPLAVMVVMLHSTPPSAVIKGGLSEYLNLVLRGICDCAVPLFFLISGYLFFINIEQFSWHVYRNKILSRVKTILVPYLIWNMLYIIFHAIQSIIFETQMQLSGKLPIQEFTFIDYLSCFWHSTAMGDGNEYFPINIPLWYLRDLFILCVVSPILWIILKSIGYWFLIIITIIYLFTEWKGICTGINPTTLTFFSIGAYIGICKIKEFLLLQRMWISYFVFILLLLIVLFFDEPMCINIKRICVLSGCIAILFFCGSTNSINRFSDMGQYTMMIYVMQVFWLTLFNQIYQRIMPSTDLTHIMSYFVLCALTVAISIYITKLGRKLMPRVMKMIGDV